MSTASSQIRAIPISCWHHSGENSPQSSLGQKGTFPPAMNILTIDIFINTSSQIRSCILNREETLSASPLLVLYHDLLTEAEMRFMKEKVAESCFLANNHQMIG